MSKSERLYDFAATIKHETDRAWLLDDGEHEPFWVPKSIGEDNGDGTFTIPEWLAVEKEIV